MKTNLDGQKSGILGFEVTYKQAARELIASEDENVLWHKATASTCESLCHHVTINTQDTHTYDISLHHDSFSFVLCPPLPDC